MARTVVLLNAQDFTEKVSIQGSRPLYLSVDSLINLGTG